jgi:hypothetical protein
VPNVRKGAAAFASTQAPAAKTRQKKRAPIGIVEQWNEKQAACVTRNKEDHRMWETAPAKKKAHGPPKPQPESEKNI